MRARILGRAKISRWQIISLSRRDNIVNRELNYFGEPKAIYYPAWLFSMAVFRARQRKEIMKRARIIREVFIRALAFQCTSDPRLIRRNLRLGGWRPRKFADRKSMIIPRSTCIFAHGVNLQRFCKSIHFIVRGRLCIKIMETIEYVHMRYVACDLLHGMEKMLLRDVLYH